MTGPTDFALLASMPRQHHVQPFRVELTERMEAAARECRGWLEAEACQVPQGAALPGDGTPSASAMAWGKG